MVAGRAVTPREKVNAERLHQYWVAGAGLAKWASSPHPWTALHRQLAKYIYDPHLLDATVSKWHCEVFHQHTGSDAYRVEHRGKIRGTRIGPG
jgi:hypothetical protein